MQAALKSVPGVQDATVTLKTKKADVAFDATKTNVAALNAAVVKAGFKSKLAVN